MPIVALPVDCAVASLARPSFGLLKVQKELAWQVVPGLRVELVLAFEPAASQPRLAESKSPR
jgi:hypothetical protein